MGCCCMERILHIMLWYAWTLQRLSRLCICFVGVGAEKGGRGERLGEVELVGV